jgi:hypothetical protein
MITLVSSLPFLTNHGKPLAPDDRLLLAALHEAGLDAHVAAWEAQHSWSQSDLTVLRSTWNYYEDYPSFVSWLAGINEQTTLMNPLPVILWNANKLYLSDLEKQGVPIIPTLWLHHKGTPDLPSLLHSTGWQKAVLKPSVSANSSNTHIITPDTSTDLVLPLLHRGTMLLQPYVENIHEGGEHSHVFIRGTWTHAFLKKKAFAVRHATEILEEPQISPSKAEIALASFVMQVAGHLLAQPLLYGRVDIIRDDAGMYRIMELELIEPALHLEYNNALALFTHAIAQQVRRQQTAARDRAPLPLLATARQGAV